MRRYGDKAAEGIVRHTLMEEALVLVEVPWERVREAARIKARGGLSYADAFVVSLAYELGAPVVTGDPEIRAAAGKVDVAVIWVGGA
ncbi:PIN domain-containing protein [Thermodesulfitimonas sp.]